MNPSSHALAVIMVGLPARGKTFIAHKIARYLEWLGYPTRVFNAGDYRRQRLGMHHPAAFFAPDNPEGTAARQRMAEAALRDMLEWIQQAGGVGIHDATNTTRARRRALRRACREASVPVLFVESVCHDLQVLETNIRSKLDAPEYRDMDPEHALADFRVRIAHYERAYEPIYDGEEGSSIKLVDVRRKIVLRDIHGHLQGRLVNFLVNTHTGHRPIFLSRHGESLYNLRGLLGGDPPLSDRGRAFARNLGAWVADRVGEQPLVAMTSTLARAVQTAAHLEVDPGTWRALDEIDAGVCEGMTYEQVQLRYPDEYAARKADKLRYRYPRGESYQDVIQRLDPVILEIERARVPVLVVAHNAVVRALYGYFAGLDPEVVPHVTIPLHTVVELVPGPYACQEQRHDLGPVTDADVTFG